MKKILTFAALLFCLGASGGNFYVRSGASGNNDGTTWANAYTNLTAALTNAAGSTFWVANDHAETTAGAVTLTTGTAASPSKIICVNTHATEPPTGVAVSATVSNSTSVAIVFRGFCYCYGITFNSSTAASSSVHIDVLDNSANAGWWKFDSCALKINTANNSTGCRIAIGVASSSAANQFVEFCNTTVAFGETTSQGMVVKNARFSWRNTASAIGGTVPTKLFYSGSQLSGQVVVEGVDLSAMGSGKSIVETASAQDADYLFLNCKLGASVGLTTGAIAGQGGIRLSFVNCDSGNTGYKYYKQDYSGAITNEITIVRTQGATDGTTPISYKMVTTANSSFVYPLVADPIVFWNESTSAITVTIPVVTDGVTLSNNQAWVDIDYLGTSGVPLAIGATSRMADIMATPAVLPTDSTSTWTTTGLSSPVKQSLAVTFTPALKGLVRVRVNLALASTPMYFDPLAITSGRQYQGTVSYVNEGKKETSSAVAQ